ncbi:MAG: hypothetical protein R3B70_20010 [Polyangiaceae bacterium]
MNVALKIDAPASLEAANRRAVLLALPVSDEPMTDEEEALFEKLESFVRSGQRGLPHADVAAMLESRRGEEDEDR